MTKDTLPFKLLQIRKPKSPFRNPIIMVGSARLSVYTAFRLRRGVSPTDQGELRKMEKRCHKCGSPVGTEQAFCPTWGAVIGLGLGATQAGGGWDLASAGVGKPPSTPQGSPAGRGGRPSRAEAAAPAAP